MKRFIHPLRAAAALDALRNKPGAQAVEYNGWVIVRDNKLLAETQALSGWVPRQPLATGRHEIQHRIAAMDHRDFE